jgi:hypothetical protein
VPVTAVVLVVDVVPLAVAGSASWHAAGSAESVVPVVVLDAAVVAAGLCVLVTVVSGVAA